MVLPVVAYGDPILRRVAKEIDKTYPDLDILINNMWETMEKANGIGIAAPQIGKSVRMFLIDATHLKDDEELEPEERELLQDFKKVFINPEIIDEEGDEWGFEEGCLSIPDVREEVFRQETVHIEYLDENFQPQKATLFGIAARVFQHEFDHIEGILFTDKISSLKKRLIKKKLDNIAKGKIKADYKIKFYSPKRR